MYKRFTAQILGVAALFVATAFAQEDSSVDSLASQK